MRLKYTVKCSVDGQWPITFRNRGALEVIVKYLNEKGDCTPKKPRGCGGTHEIVEVDDG